MKFCVAFFLFEFFSGAPTFFLKYVHHFERKMATTNYTTQAGNTISSGPADGTRLYFFGLSSIDFLAWQTSDLGVRLRYIKRGVLLPFLCVFLLCKCVGKYVCVYDAFKIVTDRLPPTISFAGGFFFGRCATNGSTPSINPINVDSDDFICE